MIYRQTAPLIQVSCAGACVGASLRFTRGVRLGFICSFKSYLQFSAFIKNLSSTKNYTGVGLYSLNLVNTK